MATSWAAQLDNKEHKNWVMVGCALNIAKNGITQVIQGKMETWYQSLISNAPLQSLPACSCVPGSTALCGTCRTWKTELRRYHKFNQPKIPNSDRTQWGSVTGAWEIAKVFMSALGSRKTQVVDAETTDIGGLLNLLEQCPFIQPPVNPTVLCSTRDQCRNHWAHAPKQELQDADVNAIFGHLTALLADPVFNADSAAQKSAKDLQDLFHHGLVNIRDSEVEALHLLRQSLVEDLAKCRDDLADVQHQVVQLDTETKKVNASVQKGITQLGTEVEGIKRVLNDKISKILNAVENFNRLMNERDDLKGAFQLISEDLENIAMELTTTKSQVAKIGINLERFQRDVEIKFASMECEVKGLTNDAATTKNKILSLQEDVTKVREEVESLKAHKPSEEWNSDDGDTVYTGPSRLPAFTGREEALAWLEQSLTPDQRPVNIPGTSCCTKAICGLGGCGKTSLAVEFSWRYKNRFPGGVFWINGESDENFSESVVENLALLNIPASTSEKVGDTLNRFLVRLSKEKNPWLLVVDNADELQDSTCPAGVKKICKGPSQRNGNASKQGHILLTTRRNAKDTETFLKIKHENCFQLQCFSDQEGAQFLMQRTGFKGDFLDQNAVLLAKELGCLPLALEQAAAYLSALPMSCSFKAYLDKYQAVRLHLLKQQPATALSVEAQHRLSVHTTWKLNFESVKEKSPAAATMMHIAAFLESDNVLIAVINPGFPELDQEELREGARSEFDVDAILKVLSSYSLLSVDQKRRVFAIHKLVQEVVRESLNTQAKVEILVAAARVLHFALKAKNERDTITALLLSFRTLTNHMEEESKLLKEGSLHTLYNHEILDLCFFVCKFVNDDLSLVRVYADLFEFKLRVLSTVYSDADQPDMLLSTMSQTGFFKQVRSVPQIDKEAKKLSDNAVKKLIAFEESGVKVDVDTKYDVLRLSASFHCLESNWEENYKALLKLEELPVSVEKSLELQQEIARAERFLSPCNPQTALRRYQNTLKIARKAYSSNHPSISNLLHNISNLLLEAGKVEEAKPYAEELWNICKNQSLTSSGYIIGMRAAMRVKCHFDPQATENILVDILKRHWPHIYRIADSASHCQVNFEEISVGDGTEAIFSLFFGSLLECAFVLHDSKAGEHKFETSKLYFYKTIAEIKLCIDSSLFGEIHPRMKEAYEYLERVHKILGDKKEVSRLKKLIVKCGQMVPDNKFVHQNNPLPLNNNLSRFRQCLDGGSILFRAENYSDALELYNQALSLSPDDAKLLTNKAATCVKLSQQSSVEEKQNFLEQALQASQNAITTDPSWMKGYYWKAVCLAHLDKRGPSLAAAAVAKHLFPSHCATIPDVVDRFGNYNVRVIATILDLLYATERKNSRNAVIVVKKGKYQLPSPLKIPKNAVILGLGDVQICCPTGVPLQLEETVYLENVSLYPTLETLKEKAKKCLTDGQVDEALSLYSQALMSCPNSPQFLTSRASCYLRSAELKKDNPSERKSVLELGLKDAEAAISADPAWLLGYYTKAAILAELDRKQQALAAAAMFKHLSSGRDVPGVTQRHGDLEILVIQSALELCSVHDRIKRLEGVNQSVLFKEGEYQCERSVEIPPQIIVVGQGKVTVSCKNGAPFRFTETCYVENVKIIADCGNDHEDKQQ